MEFDRIIEKRSSVRSFKGRVVSWKDVLYAVDAATKGPGAGGDLALKFIIVENPDTIDKLADHADQSWINKSSMILIVTSDDKHLEKLYGDRGRVYSRQQAGAAINTILLKLVDLGLGACWVGSYDDKMIRKVLQIPEEKQIEAIIPIGYEKPAIKKASKSRKRKIEHYLFWDKWNQKSRNYLFKETISRADEQGHPI